MTLQGWILSLKGTPSEKTGLIGKNSHSMFGDVLAIFPKEKTSLRVQIDQILPPHFLKKCFGTSE